MERDTVLETLTQILRDVFDDDNLVATPELTAARVHGWDSLGNIRFFMEVERVFSLRFSAAEIASLPNVGQLAALIRERNRGQA